MKRILTLFTLTFALCSCADNPKSNQQQSAQADSNNYSTNAASLDLRPQVTKPDTPEVAPPAQRNVVQPGPNEIINKDFANMPLGYDQFKEAYFNILFNGRYNIYKYPIKNKYADHIDTLIYIKKGNSVAKFYKTIDKMMLDSLSIEDSNFTNFIRKIDVGYSKAALLAEFGAIDRKTYGDSINIVNDEYDGEVTIYFDKKNRVKKIYTYTPMD